MKLFILYSVRDTQPQFYNDGTGDIAEILLITESELEALKFKDQNRCKIVSHQCNLKWGLTETKDSLKKRQDKVGKDIMLFNSYEHVIQDLIGNTDPCTGELH